MIDLNYKNHNFIEITKTSLYNFRCVKCGVRIFYLINNFDNFDNFNYRFEINKFSQLTCEEIIIKGILE